MVKKCLLMLAVFLAINESKSEEINYTNHSRLTVVVMLHLYNLDLMDEFIGRINQLVVRNQSFNFYIKINIPVSKNIDNFFGLQVDENISSQEKKRIYNYCLTHTPYHSDVITQKNCVKLFAIHEYLKSKLSLTSGKIQILFSQNRGVDVGGFFLMLDQLIQQNLQHDYIIKLHSKTHEKWRNRLLTMLDLDLKAYLPKYDAIYGCQRMCNDQDPRERKVRKRMRFLLKKFNLRQKKAFFFPAGTMFIASSKITNFFKPFNRIEIYNQLQLDYKVTQFATEHIYERLFGYLMDTLEFNVYYCNKHVSVHLL